MGGNFLSALSQKLTFVLKIKINLRNLRTVKLTTRDEKVKQELTQLKEELEQFQVELNDKHQNFVDSYNAILNEDDDDDDILPGLNTQIVQKFDQFTADELFVDDQCVICMEDIEIGRNMMRLDCDGQHTFCQVCIVRWFANHKTCPTCRHAF